MTLSPTWRNRLFGGGAALLTLWVAFQLAQGLYVLPGFVAAALLLFLLARAQPLPITAALLGVITFGYVVGNRGFAQLMISPRFPLLPAEIVLLIGGALLLVQAAWRHELPFRRDPLHLLLLGWIGYGAVRVAFDLRDYGFMALRDFATVYYALFFFLAHDVQRHPGSARAIERVLLVSCLVLAVTALLFEYFPGFFYTVLTVRGLPLIFYKGDLVGTFLAVGSVLLFLRHEATRRWWPVLPSIALAAGVVATNNRASMLGLLVAAAWLAIGRRWRFAAVLGGSGALAALIMLAAAAATNTSWEKTPVFGVYERVVSIFDPNGRRVYRGEDTSYKGDNNLFRTVWWTAVINETAEENPYLGLGFGRDLAARFVREYYPEASEEFSTRSPHNILLTIFARMGALGLAWFLAMFGVVAVRTWRAVRAGPRAAGLWCAVWVILTAACFGVVLEGPMGAVVFWTVLGLAPTEPANAPAETAEVAEAPAPAPS
jgi:O-antigen ligase